MRELPSADLAGATGPSYTTPATGTGDSGTRSRVIATNGSGAVTSAVATLTVSAIPVAPAISSHRRCPHQRGAGCALPGCRQRYTHAHLAVAAQHQ